MAEIIPADVKLAAKRGFVRTTFQGYAAAIPAGGITAAALLPLVQDPNPMSIVVSAVAVLVSPLLAGLASYLSISSKGIPEDYQTVAIVEG